MSDDVAEWDQESATPTPAPSLAGLPTLQLPPQPGTESADTPAPETGVPTGPQLFFGSVDEFLRENLRFTYARRVGPQGSMRWAADWWRYPEAISRLDAL